MISEQLNNRVFEHLNLELKHFECSIVRLFKCSIVQKTGAA